MDDFGDPDELLLLALQMSLQEADEQSITSPLESPDPTTSTIPTETLPASVIVEVCLYFSTFTNSLLDIYISN